MFTKTIACDQAIFTSVRTPMGEGYRIIAASRGLRPEEKQAITRFSPSHEALCPLEPGATSPNGVHAVAFYTLPTKRVCVACSCDAGEEQSGRGGLRVYTHNLVFDAADLETCGFNPFAVVRAMAELGLTTPQLKPPAVLDALDLPVPDSATSVPKTMLDNSLNTAWRKHVLESLLSDRSLVLNIGGDWLSIAEALLMGLPGPMREAVAFVAGLRFSVSRCHRLALLTDDPAQTKSRVAGRQVEYAEPASSEAPLANDSAWLLFVERHWSRGDLDGLAHRTSRPFASVSLEARERVGKLYNDIDAVPQTDTSVLLDNVLRHLGREQEGVEAGIVTELVVAAQRSLTDRFDRMPWDDAQQYWLPVVQAWRGSEEGCLFATPLVDRLLAQAERKHPTVAADAAFQLAQQGAATIEGLDTSALIERVLTRLANWAEQAVGRDLEQLPGLCNRWRAVRPTCPILDRVERRCTAVAGPVRRL